MRFGTSGMIGRAGWRGAGVGVAFGGLLATTGQAAVLLVGPGQVYAVPSVAIGAARDGDTILIAPGSYFDCAIVRRNGLTIAGDGTDGAAVLTDKTCAGKALLVIDGADITVRNLTLARARVPDGNGAGIRAEGRNLTVERVSFVNDQVGILAASVAGSSVVVRDSTFRANGRCDPRCGHGIAVGGIGRFVVSGSDFTQAGGGDHIVSAAEVTELVGDRLEDQAAMSGPMVVITGGAVRLRGNTVTLGAGAERPGAVLVVGDATRIEVRGNTLDAPAGSAVPLVRNWTGQTAIVADNVVPSGMSAVSDDGGTYHRLRAAAARLRMALRHVAGSAWRAVAGVVR